VVVDIEEKSHQSLELSYITLKTHLWQPWRGCSMNVVFQSQIVGYDINVSKTFMMVILTIEDGMGKVLEGIVLALMC
jgi:hypothetical protein